MVIVLVGVHAYVMMIFSSVIVFESMKHNFVEVLLVC